MRPEDNQVGRVYRRNRWHRWFVESIENGKATASRLGAPAIDSVETFAAMCDLDVTPRDAVSSGINRDLLAACKRALELDAVSPNCDEIYNELRDVISKAEGAKCSDS